MALCFSDCRSMKPAMLGTSSLVTFHFRSKGAAQISSGSSHTVQLELVTLRRLSMSG